MTESVVWIDGPAGKIPAIVHVPAVPDAQRTCIVMLNAGRVGRAGPQRLYLKAARAWVETGVAVLRVDLAGVGDSQAENEALHFDSHSVGEVIAAVRYAKRSLDAGSIVLQGLCAGARAAFKAAVLDPDVTGVLAWSCPVFSSAEVMPSSPDSEVGVARVRHKLRRLAAAVLRRKLLDARWWRKRWLLRRVELPRLCRGVLRMLRRERAPSNLFLDSVDTCLRKGLRVLFVYGSRDRVALEEFAQRFPTVSQGVDRPQGYCVLRDATHTFGTLQAQRDAIEVAAHWLAARAAPTPPVDA